MAESSGSDQVNGSETAAPQASLAPNSTSAIFISYASQDAAIADALCAALENEGVACWIAPRNVRPGAFYADAIVNAINACPALVLVLSKYSVDSAHVLREVERASAKKRPIIAFRIDTAPLPPGLEYFLSASQWIDASSGAPERGFPKLVEALRDRSSSTPKAEAGRPTVQPPAKRSLNRILMLVTAVVAAAFLTFVIDKFWLSKRATMAQAAIPATSGTAEATAAVPALSDRSIAVLPFTDMSEKKDQEYFADGMAEEIIDLLVKVPDLKVPARTSSFYFKGKSTQIPEIARELGVAHVLEGSVRKSGDRLRVTAQLIRADNGYHLWSETYDRHLQDVFKVQDDIANAVVQALQITLMGGPLTRRAGGTQNLDAYELYLRGLSAMWRNTRQSLSAARDYFNQSIKLDPSFGLAWAQLAFNTGLQTDNADLPYKEGFESERQFAQHALQLSPDLAEAHALLQYVHRVYDWDWAASEAEGRQALALDPTNPLALMFAGQTSYTLGRFEDAERQVRMALVRDPFFTIAIWSLGTAQYCGGKLSEAEATYRKLFAVAPEFLWTRLYLGKTLLAEGKPEAALAMLRQEKDEEMRLLILPIVLLAIGHQAEADDALKEIITKFGDRDPYTVAMNYAYRGNNDLALQWLERAYKQKDDFSELVGEPLFKKLANDPRYKAFLRRMNLPE